MKVLIAEDDMHIRNGLADLLSDEGYQCIEAANGSEAWQIFQQQHPEIVLADIMMPGMDGYSLCREIRQVDKQVPVIFITARSEEIDQVLGLELGADDYIKKPFGTREVVARIKAVVRRSYQQHTQLEDETADFQMANWCISPTSLRASNQDTTIELSPRDIRILSLLYRQRGKVVDRDQLFNHAWGRHYLPSSRTLDQHISKLRKLIEINPSSPLIIKTVHGVGYRFDD